MTDTNGTTANANAANDSTAPLLPSDGSASDGTPELVDEHDDQVFIEEEEGYPEDIVAGLVIPLSSTSNSVGCRSHHGRLYPAFQSGYSTPWRGNPLPARVMEYYCTTSRSSSSNSGGDIEAKWNELLKAINEPVVKYHSRQSWLLAIMLLTLLVVIPLLIPLALHSTSTRGVSIVVFVVLTGLVAGCQLLKCATQEPLLMAVKDIAEARNASWKDEARIQLKLVQPRQSGGCCGVHVCRPSEAVLLFEKYIPVSERQAQIAFV